MGTDSADATRELLDWARDGRIRLSVGLDLTVSVREAILGVPDDDWAPALRQDGEQRDGAWVTEITDRLDMGGRRERPTPGGQLYFSDHDGHRFLATLTDGQGDAVEIGHRHRARANAEDRVRCAKQTGLENLPFRDFELNAVGSSCR